MDIQKLDITVTGDLENDAVKILSILRPDWKRCDVKFKVFTDGITNRLLGCQHMSDVDQKDVVLIRVYGECTDLIIDRNVELQNMQLMHLIDCAKPAYAKFNNGIVYGFIPGECLDDVTVRDPHIARLIAREMVKMQGVNLDSLVADHPEVASTDRKPCIFTKTRGYIDHIPEGFSEPERNKRFLTEVPNKAAIIQEFDLVKEELEKLHSPVVFSHNDLLLKNIVFSKEEDRTYFIDFEYGGFNYEAYDIAGHFCEYAGIQTVDYTLYPDKEYQVRWMKNFLEFQFERDGKTPQEVTATDVERLYVQTNKFTLMCHLFWGVWGLIQASVSTIDFDFLDYSILRFNEYFKRKEEFLALKMPSS